MRRNSDALMRHGVHEIRRGLRMIQEALGEFGGELSYGEREPLLQHALEICRRCERMETLLELSRAPLKIEAER